jgi:prepilin-type N-terminal cleavage/methylation domain-containing protein
MLAKGDRLMTERPLKVFSLKRFRGFTLIELLVVISIMALLMAILLPALQKAKESGEMAKCQSNVKQITIAHLNYTQDFKNWWFASNWQYFGVDKVTGVFDDSGRTISYLMFVGHGGIPHPVWHQTVPPSKTSDQPPTIGGGYIFDGYEEPTKFVNPYANLPATMGNNDREMFELFECPGDTKQTLTWPCIYSTYGSIHPSFVNWYGTKFNHWGSSYSYISGTAGWAAPLTPYTSVPNAPELDMPYSGQGLWGAKVSDVDLPSLQVVISDFHGAAWGQGAVMGWGTDIANWLFHGHTEGGWARSSGSRLHNMGHVDGHVKTHDIPDTREAGWGNPTYGEFSFNGEYRFYLEKD